MAFSSNTSVGKGVFILPKPTPGTPTLPSSIILADSGTVLDSAKRLALTGSPNVAITPSPMKAPASPSDSQAKCKRKLNFAKLGLPLDKHKSSPKTVEKRNARERNRVKTINTTFEDLRDHLPCGDGVLQRKKQKKMSKVDILKGAIDYISMLKDLLEETDSESLSSQQTSSHEVTSTTCLSVSSPSPASPCPSHPSPASFIPSSPAAFIPSSPAAFIPSSPCSPSSTSVPSPATPSHHHHGKKQQLTQQPQQQQQQPQQRQQYSQKRQLLNNYHIQRHQHPSKHQYRQQQHQLYHQQYYHQSHYTNQLNHNYSNNDNNNNNNIKNKHQEHYSFLAALTDIKPVGDEFSSSSSPLLPPPSPAESIPGSVGSSVGSTEYGASPVHTLHRDWAPDEDELMTFASWFQ